MQTPENYVREVEERFDWHDIDYLVSYDPLRIRIFRVHRGNQPSKPKVIQIYGALQSSWPVAKDGAIDLNLHNNRLVEYVLVFDGNIPIRSHEETDNEGMTNIGNVPVVYRRARNQPNTPGDLVSPSIEDFRLMPGQIMHSVLGKAGFYHGLDLPAPGIGKLYIAKAVLPGFEDFNCRSGFRIPENTYRGPQ